MKIPGIALALALVLAAPAAATVIEVPVPELLATYSCSEEPLAAGCSRSVTIQLPAMPTTIRSVAFRIHGPAALASAIRDGGAVQQVGTYLEAHLHEPGQGGSDWFAEYTITDSGAVAHTQPFAFPPLSSSTWDFLLDGAATLDFILVTFAPILECFLTGPADSTTLDDATLLVDGDFPTSVSRPSWGRLKRICR